MATKRHEEAQKRCFVPVAVFLCLFVPFCGCHRSGAGLAASSPVGWSVLKKRKNGPIGWTRPFRRAGLRGILRQRGRSARRRATDSGQVCPTERRGAAAKIGSAGRGDGALRPGKPFFEKGLLASSVSRRAPLPVGVRASSRRHSVISGCSLADSVQKSTFDLATLLEGCRGRRAHAKARRRKEVEPAATYDGLRGRSGVAHGVRRPSAVILM